MMPYFLEELLVDYAKIISTKYLSWRSFADDMNETIEEFFPNIEDRLDFFYSPQYQQISKISMRVYERSEKESQKAGETSQEENQTN